VPFVWVLLNAERRLFLFDSGAQDTILNSRLLDADQTTEGGGIIGATGNAMSHYTQVPSLQIGDWHILNSELMAIDMAHLEAELKTEIAGLIGFRHLIHFDWMVDYGKKKLHFWSRMNRNDHKIIAKALAHYAHHLPMIDLEIEGHAFRFLVDTGCSVLLLDRRHRALLLPAISGLFEEPMASASPTQVIVETGQLCGFKAADLQFGACKIQITDLSHMQSIGDFDGVIGYPLLSKYPVIQSWTFHTLYFVGE
jgi:hypothetical protein